MTAIEPDLALTTVPSAFRAAVEKYPDNTALEGQGTSLSYRELDRLSNRIANGLLARGGEQPLAMVAPLEPLPIIVMLGALKAGRIFVPLDPRDPSERLARVREQLGAWAVTANQLEELSSGSEEDPGLAPDPSGRTLVYFTSGSSGEPKGTVKSHEQLTSPASTFALESEDRFAVIVPLSFAASITPIFGTLLSGGTACLFDPITRGLPALAEWIDDAHITVLKTSPSALRILATSLEEKGRRVSGVRLAMIAGEACRAEQLEVGRRVFAQAAIMNVYGSTEAGNIAGTTIEPGEPLAPGAIPFRRVFAGQAVEIVDERGRSVAVGEPGEIVVRGSDVSVGYWEEPDKGENRFLPVLSGTRGVRTGDRGRLLPDGTLEHLGRVDLRVKIHGQMVDPQVIEDALAALSDIEEAVVSAVPGRGGDLRLVAHVRRSRQGRPKARNLRLALAQELPPFMLPVAFLPIDAIPRNERGKVDREALRESALGALELEADYVGPRNARERELADIVGDLLCLEHVGVHDDMFTLGVDSFTSVELLAGISERLGVDLTPADLLEAPTIEALARRVGDGKRVEERVVVPLHAAGSGTPFFLVAGGGGAGMLALRRLSRRLDRPTYSFIAKGFGSRALPDRTVESTAARFLGALRAVQPSGPYLIGGYSFGALVGYEMSQQLCAAGETVALLVLLDPATNVSTYRVRVQQIAAGTRRDLTSRGAKARRMVRHAVLWIAHGVELSTAGLLMRSPEHQLRVFFLLNLRMGRRYRPKPYAGRTLVLRTKSWERIDRLDLAGKLITGETQVVDIPANHITMLHEPHGTTLAGVLREALATAQEDASTQGARAGAMARAEP